MAGHRQSFLSGTCEKKDRDREFTRAIYLFLFFFFFLSRDERVENLILRDRSITSEVVAPTGAVRFFLGARMKSFLAVFCAFALTLVAAGEFSIKIVQWVDLHTLSLSQLQLQAYL